MQNVPLVHTGAPLELAPDELPPEEEAPLLEVVDVAPEEDAPLEDEELELEELDVVEDVAAQLGVLQACVPLSWQQGIPFPVHINDSF